MSKFLGLLGRVVSAVCFCLVGGLCVGQASADQPVRLESAAVKPTPFQQRIAQQNGQVLKTVPGTPLNGYLTRPPGEGPFPAVVVLHGCTGLSSSARKTWSGLLSSWGYVVLMVDSFGTRGIHETCDRAMPADRVYDAYGALEFLSEQKFVDPRRIALLGSSAGGSTTLEAVQLGGAEKLMERKFKAAVAYYPNCSASNGDMAVPTLILIGELDDWTPAQKCRQMMARRSGKASSVQLDVYPDARHAFTAPGNKIGAEDYGHRVEYNAAATEQSEKDVRLFLKEAFGG